MKTVIVIPARWQSTRLPGKPLMLIGDKTMIEHTWEKAKESLADEVIIATDFVVNGIKLWISDDTVSHAFCTLILLTALLLFNRCTLLFFL